MKRIFVGLPVFEKRWRELGLDDEARRTLELELLEDPTRGDLIRETGGIRKIRRPFPGQGKSGGLRVFYYDYLPAEKLFFFAVIKKGEQENLSKEERNILAQLLEKVLVSIKPNNRRR